MTAPVTLLVASGGGHLAELHALADRLVAPGERIVWVTEDTRQARSLLAGQHVLFIPAVRPRDYRSLGANLTGAWRVFRHADIRRVVSTGAGVALAYLPTARALGIPAYFVESAARLQGPSLTGRLLAGVPGLVRYTQSPRWASEGWRYGGTVFDGFAPVPHQVLTPNRAPVRRVVVTVGTLADYPFDRLIRRVSALLGPQVTVTWQIGASTVVPAPELGQGGAQRYIGWRELQDRIAEADVVIAHAGVGSALDVLRAGKLPILVPRRARFGEHVDDHQAQIAADLAARGLAVTCEADQLGLDHVHLAAGAAVERLALPTPLLVAPRDDESHHRHRRGPAAKASSRALAR